MAGYLEKIANALEMVGEIANAFETVMKAPNRTSDSDDEDMDEMKKENQGVELKDIAMGVVVVAGVGLLGWGTSRLLSSSSSSSTSEPPLEEKEQPKKEPKKMTFPGYFGANFTSLKILSYNVCFREDLEMHKRMKAVGDLISLHSPDLICFQEVTPNIYQNFQQSSWWKVYRCSVSNQMAFSRPYFCMQLSKLPVKSYSCKPFSNSVMGRELCVAEVEVERDMLLVVATSHLESSCPDPTKWDHMYKKERVDQVKEALNLLKKNPNVIFCGDMNWNNKLDGQFPLPNGWIDAWLQKRPGENGWTYDTKSNKMLAGNRPLQKRLDRFVCKLHGYKITGIDMIGMEAIPGVSYCKEKKMIGGVQKLVIPVLPSDHYGLLLTIRPQ